MKIIFGLMFLESRVEICYIINLQLRAFVKCKICNAISNVCCCLIDSSSLNYWLFCLKIKLMSTLELWALKTAKYIVRNVTSQVYIFCVLLNRKVVIQFFPPLNDVTTQSEHFVKLKNFQNWFKIELFFFVCLIIFLRVSPGLNILLHGPGLEDTISNEAVAEKVWKGDQNKKLHYFF